MIDLALDAAAAAGRLAGGACLALWDLFASTDAVARGLDDDLDFDEAAADSYLRDAALDCGLGGLPTGTPISALLIDSQFSELVAAQKGAPGPPRSDSDRLDQLIVLVEDVRNLVQSCSAGADAAASDGSPAEHSPAPDLPRAGGAGSPHADELREAAKLLRHYAGHLRRAHELADSFCLYSDRLIALDPILNHNK